jgi:hypothetical protein
MDPLSVRRRAPGAVVVALGGGYHASATTTSDLSGIPEACLTEEVFWASGAMVE